MEKSLARRTTDTSRSSDKDSASTAGTTAVEDRREPALTIAYSPKESNDIKIDIIFVGGVDGPNPLSDSWFNSQNDVHWPSQLLPTDVPTARVFMYRCDLDTEIPSLPPKSNILEWHATKLLADFGRIRVDTHMVRD